MTFGAVYTKVRNCDINFSYVLRDKDHVTKLLGGFCFVRWYKAFSITVGNTEV